MLKFIKSLFSPRGINNTYFTGYALSNGGYPEIFRADNIWTVIDYDRYNGGHGDMITWYISKDGADHLGCMIKSDGSWWITKSTDNLESWVK